MSAEQPSRAGLRDRLHEIIFEADTPTGKAFDVALIGCILASVVAIMLESVKGIDRHCHELFQAVEVGFTLLFTAEYVVRLWVVDRPMRYARSFFGVVDLLSVLPTYLGLLFTGYHAFLVIRVLRLLRLFRILKLMRFVREARVLRQALRASMPKITVFLFTVFTVVIIVGAMMYVVEGPKHGFTSIPTSMYWAVVTLTTVGYGDITPDTPLGKILSACLMILGYAIIAVPTGIVSVELSAATRLARKTTACPACGHGEHDDDATFCKACGAQL